MDADHRVLWISCVGDVGGAEVYMLNLLRHMPPSAVAPTVAMLRPGLLSRHLRQLNVPVVDFAPHRMRNLIAVCRGVRRLVRVIREREITAVHSNGFRAHVYGGLAARQAGIPAFWSVHTPERPGIATRAILAIPAAHVLANSPRTAEFFQRNGHTTSILWPAVDEKRLGNRTARNALASRYGIPPEARWICQGARLQRYKGQEFLIQAVASLPARHDDVHCVIMGGSLFGQEPEFAGRLAKQAAALGVSRRIHFTGFVPDDDLHGFLSESALVMHPALEEDFGLIVAEGMALGVPVIAFASSGPRILIDDRETGRLVPVGDQAALNGALTDALDHPDAAREWGRRARRSVLDRFGADAMAARLCEVYQSTRGLQSTRQPAATS